MDRKRNVTPKYSYMLVLALIAAMTVGCSVRNAVTDGFFSAISEIVSTVVLNLASPAL